MDNDTIDARALEDITLAVRNWVTAHQLARLEAEKAAASDRVDDEVER